MELFVKEDILHIVYISQRNVSREIIEIANLYEGVINNRIGFNFPISFVKKVKPKSELLEYGAKYVIVYKKGDILTKKHELMHALYALNPEYRSKVIELWNSFSEDYRKQIISMLLKME